MFSANQMMVQRYMSVSSTRRAQVYVRRVRNVSELNKLFLFLDLNIFFLHINVITAAHAYAWQAIIVCGGCFFFVLTRITDNELIKLYHMFACGRSARPEFGFCLPLKLGLSNCLFFDRVTIISRL